MLLEKTQITATVSFDNGETEIDVTDLITLTSTDVLIAEGVVSSVSAGYSFEGDERCRFCFHDDRWKMNGYCNSQQQYGTGHSDNIMSSQETLS